MRATSGKATLARQVGWLAILVEWLAVSFMGVHSLRSTLQTQGACMRPMRSQEAICGTTPDQERLHNRSWHTTASGFLGGAHCLPPEAQRQHQPATSVVGKNPRGRNDGGDETSHRAANPRSERRDHCLQTARSAAGGMQRSAGENDVPQDRSSRSSEQSHGRSSERRGQKNAVSASRSTRSSDSLRWSYPR